MKRIASADRADIEREEQVRLHSLIKAGLVSEDPEADPSLVFPLPPGTTDFQIVVGYDTKNTTGRLVRCAACPQHQPHHRGFRVELVDNRHANIGFYCGEKHFGEGAWQIALNDYDQRVKEAHFNARVAPTLEMLDGVMPIINGWHDKTKELAKLFSDFRSALPELHQALVTASRLRGGRLELEKRVRKDSVNRAGIVQTKTTTELTPVGRIPYPDFFLGTSPNSLLSGAKQDIGIALELLGHNRDTATLAKAFRSLQQARQRLGEAAEVHRRVQQNLNEDWLPGMCRWANASEDLAALYKIEGRTITRVDSEVEWTFDLPHPDVIGSPPMRLIEALWRTT